MKRETPKQKVSRILTTVPRLFIISLDGIWRTAYGVYVEPLVEPFIVKVVYNGRSLIFPDPRYCVDYSGYDNGIVEKDIVRRNISTLPKLPPGPKLIYTYSSPASRRYGGVANFPSYYTSIVSSATTLDLPVPPIPAPDPEPEIIVRAEGPIPIITPNTMFVDTVAGEPPVSIDREEESFRQYIDTGDEALIRALIANEDPPENPLAS